MLVGRSVYPLVTTVCSVKNGLLDKDAIWGGEWSGPKEWCIRLLSRSPMGRANYGGNGWHNV